MATRKLLSSVVLRFSYLADDQNFIKLSFVNALVSSEAPPLRPCHCNCHDVTSCVCLLPNHLGTSVLAENSTAHYCWVLWLWKAAFRGRTPWKLTPGSHSISFAPKPCVCTLRNAVTFQMWLPLPATQGDSNFLRHGKHPCLCPPLNSRGTLQTSL